MPREGRDRRRRGRESLELNYVIRFRPEYLDKVLRGEKRVTLRLGIVRPRFGEVLIACGNRAYGLCEIESMEITSIDKLDDKIVKMEGFKSREELIRALRSLYPEVAEKDLVTIIRFRVSKIFQRPIPLNKAVTDLKGGYIHD
ncbi:MAG: ASCH domain-containing protein [Crenarchaeota archaeon]|nr:ASCH domain-containing protein [Thermoproteota archaeon]